MFIRIVSMLGAMAATAAMLAFATPAAAQTEDQVTVSFADLDLARPADAARLDRRLLAAAEKVCGPDDSRDYRIHRQSMACQKTALSRANSDVRVALRGNAGTEVALTTR
jgi:UrcA family protein